MVLSLSKAGESCPWLSAIAERSAFDEAALITVMLYDLVVPSSYYVPELIDEGLIQPVDHSQLSNFGNLYPSTLPSH